MTISDLLIEGIQFSPVCIGGVTNEEPYWTGMLYAGMENDIRTKDGLPDWFAKMEVLAIGSGEDGLIMIVG